MTLPAPSRPKRRWRKLLASILVLALALAAGLPWLLGTGFARGRIAASLNAALSPGRIQFETIQLSWFGPTRLGSVSLLDPKGAVVARVPSAVFDRNLGQLILKTGGPSTLTLDGAALDIVRTSDGQINLAQALRTLIDNPDPLRDITIRIAKGSIRYRDPVLAGPTEGDALDLTLHIAAAPNPLTWSLKIGQGAASLDVHGDFDRWLSKGGAAGTQELQIGVVGKGWPIAARFAGVDASGRLDGSLDFVRKRGHWVLSGDAKWDDVVARGGPMAGDSLAFDRLTAGWDLAEGTEGWTIRRFGLACPLGNLKAEGQVNGPGASGKQRLEGTLDLAEVARQIPHALRLRPGLAVDRGSARVAVDLTSTPGRTTYELEARLSDMTAHDRERALSLRDPATILARLVRSGTSTTVERLAVKTAFLDASAAGTLAEGVEVVGTLDLAAFRKQVGDWVDLGAIDCAGVARLSGTFKVGEKSDAHRYETRWSALVRDFRLSGVGPGVVRRDQAQLELVLNGPAEAAGWPSGWDRVDAQLVAGTTMVHLDLAPRPGGMAIRVDGRLPIASNARPDAYLAGDLIGAWSADSRVLTLGSVQFDAIIPDARQIGSRVQALATGRLDVARGELTLTAPPGDPIDSIVPGLDGWRISGIGQGLGALRAEGSLAGDSANLDAFVANLAGRASLGLSGRWLALASVRGDESGMQVSGKVSLIDPNPTSPPARPTSMALRAHYATTLDRLDLSEFTVSTPLGTLDASGRLEEPWGLVRVDLSGRLAPDFAAINALLASRVEPGAKVEGVPRAFRATGNLRESSSGWKGLDAEFGFDLKGADIYGMKFGPSPVVLRTKSGRLTFDPISTTLNDGHIRLEPEIDLEAPGGPVLRLAKNSTVREARINDEVSKRVLAFVAPVLDQATRASGLVSVDLDYAEFPIGPGRGRQAKVEGAVVFQNVEFAPGPLAADLLGAIGRRDLTLRMDQPVTLTIADGRVNQRGMSIPVGDFTRIEMAGWVDFDRNLAITATVPVTPAMLGNIEILADIAAGTKVKLPIGGTLDRPQIDKEAFAANLQETGRSLLTRGATRGALELLMRMGRPKDPNAPPPPPRPTAEDRKAMRQEKKAIRRGEIPPPPPPPTGNPDVPR